MDDQTIGLIRAARRGDKDAFSRLVDSYKNYVVQLAFGVLQNRMDAEDVSQEAFIKAFKSLHHLQEERTFSAWLARITVNTALDFKRKRDQHGHVNVDDIEQLSNHRDESDQVVERMSLSRAMGNLSEDHRTILVLRDVQGFDYMEISKILDIPVGTVRSRLHNARTLMRKLLKSTN